MNYLLAPLAAGAYAIAVEDTHSWDVASYTNCYVLRRNGQILLIDAGLKAYQPAIVAALAEIGITPDMVTHVLLTHGHHDHVQGAALFPQAKKYVHSADMPLIARPLAPEFTAFAAQAGEFLYTVPDAAELAIVLVNTHSPGSVAIYDPVSRALFVGDFFCYFGEALPDGQLVTDSDFIRRGSCQYVAGQAAAGGTEFKRFMQGLSRLLAYQPEFFCTGHGVILREDIQGFLEQMWQSGTQNRQA